MISNGATYYLLLAALSRRIRTRIRTFRHHPRYRPLEVRLASPATHQQTTSFGQPSFSSPELSSSPYSSDNVLRPSPSLFPDCPQLVAACTSPISFNVGAGAKDQGLTREGA